MSSTDDDAPLVARPLLKPAKLTTRVVSSDDDSPMPSWLVNVKAPTGGVLAALSDSSDSDAKEVLSPPVSHKNLSQQQQEQQKVANAGLAAQPGQQKQQRQAGPRAPRSAGKSLPAGDVGAVPSSQVVAAPSSQQQQLQPAAGGTAQKKASAGARGVGAGAGMVAREMPLVLPEKLAQAKLLVELEAGGDEAAHGATDLSGDSGAIGRLLIVGPPGDTQMQIDLKGGPGLGPGTGTGTGPVLGCHKPRALPTCPRTCAITGTHCCLQTHRRALRCHHCALPCHAGGGEHGADGGQGGDTAH